MTEPITEQPLVIQADDREVRCRHCDARQSLAGYLDVAYTVEVGDGAPQFLMGRIDSPREIVMNCDICDNEGRWREMGYIWYRGITAAEKEAQKEPWA